jgi:hypothetical protein
MEMRDGAILRLNKTNSPIEYPVFFYKKLGKFIFEYFFLKRNFINKSMSQKVFDRKRQSFLFF